MQEHKSLKRIVAAVVSTLVIVGNCIGVLAADDIMPLRGELCGKCYRAEIVTTETYEPWEHIGEDVCIHYPHVWNAFDDIYSRRVTIVYSCPACSNVMGPYYRFETDVRCQVK